MNRKKLLESEITFKELTEAMQQLSSGQSPGIDGLPVKFYQQFWNVIGMDLYEVFLSCFKEKSLPLSCRRAVLSLLPKKGIYVY